MLQFEPQSIWAVFHISRLPQALHRAEAMIQHINIHTVTVRGAYLYLGIVPVDEMGNPASLSCAENIALFHFLHAGRGKDGVLWRDSVPTLPSVAPGEALPTKHRDHFLSFERERSVAGALPSYRRSRMTPTTSLLFAFKRITTRRKGHHFVYYWL